MPAHFHFILSTMDYMLHRWWKKCPLEISHPDKELLSQQKSFFLFASDGFAKTQW